MSGLQKSGYLKVKQPSSVKSRKIKSWKLRWVVLHKMSNIAEGTFAAKIDLYHNEDACRKLSQDRITFILENITAIQPSGSKSHKNAFDIVGISPLLSLSALSETDTVDWVKTLQQLFWPAPDQDGKDLFQIIIEENEDSRRFSLSGEYWLLISPESLTVKAMSKAQSMEWKLSNLKRFNLDKHDSKILIIESGAKSDIGEARFTFRSNDVPKIFYCIRKNIKVAVEKRHRKFSSSSDGRDRSSSATNSENEFKVLLENSNDDLSTTTGVSSRSSSPQLKNKLHGSPSPQLKNKLHGSPSPQLKSKLHGSPSPQLKSKLHGSPSPQLKCKSRSLGSPHLSNEDSISASDKKQPPVNADEESEDQAEEPLVCLGDMEPLPCNSAALKNKNISASYDELNFSASSNKKEDIPEIVSTEIIHDKSNKREIEIEHDSKGYSHITKRAITNKPETDQLKDDYLDMNTQIKVRSASDQSSQSMDTQRSESISSHDSGCVVSHCDRERRRSDGTVQSTSEKKTLHRSCNSFDSAISTTLTSDVITASVKDEELVAVCDETSTDNAKDTNQTKEEYRTNSQNNIYADIHQGGKTSYEEVKESEYEDLEKYRKDLSKFLGMDPKVNPSDVPPSLPDRPTTLPIRRKDMVKKAKHKLRQKKKVTFNSSKTKSKNARRSNSLSSSTSSTEEDDTENVTRVKMWPLNNSVKLMKNTLYEPAEIVSPSDTADNNDELQRPRHSSDSALLELSNHHYSTAEGHGYATVTAKKPKSHVLDLLTGDPIELSATKTDTMLVPHPNDDVRSVRTTSIPPPVEQLIPLDIPANRNSELVFNSPVSECEDEKIIFRAKDDGNFVWDPFPKMGKFEAPIIDFGNRSVPSFASEKESLNLKIKTEATQPEKAFNDSLDPFDIFHLGFSTSDQKDESSHNIPEQSKQEILSELKQFEPLINPEENTYMEMSRPIIPTDGDYLRPSDA